MTGPDAVPAEYDEIIEAIALIEDARSTYPYVRSSSGVFYPPNMTIPTWLWHKLVGAQETYFAFGDGEVSDTFADDGSIDQYELVFRVIARLDFLISYISRDDTFIPKFVEIPTSDWNEIVQLSRVQSVQLARMVLRASPKTRNSPISRARQNK